MTWLNFSVQLDQKIRPQAAGSVKTSEVSLLLEELKIIPACWDIGHHTQNHQLWPTEHLSACSMYQNQAILFLLR